MEQNEDALDEWRDSVMSPKGLFSGFISEPCLMKQIQLVSSAGDSALGDNIERELENSKLNFQKRVDECESAASAAIVVDNQGPNVAGSIAERRAAKFGFNASKINNNTPRFRFSPLASPAARSPYLTIPPGISPTALLDSPILLPSPQPSPSTGTFALPTMDHDYQIINTASHTSDGDKGCVGGSSLRFKPHASPFPRACFSALQNQEASTNNLAQNLGVELDCHTFACVSPPVVFVFPAEPTMKTFDTCLPSDAKSLNDLAMNTDSSVLQLSHSDHLSGDEMRHNNESIQEDTVADHSIDEDHKGMYPPMENVRTLEDGYNWRKYGQKQVKGSEYPRSYYKCTWAHCPAKKKVERSHDGQITEIIYKGAHNHPKPQPSRHSTFGSGPSFIGSSEVAEGSGSYVKADDGPVWQSIQYGCKDIKVGADWRADGLERTPSTSVVTEVSGPMSTTQGKLVGVLESVGTQELSSTLTCHEDNEEDAPGSMSLGDEDDHESDSKRRKKESSLIEATLSSRAVREPRVVVQIESEVDVLDDGYRWRKYGQKVVKGNPNPRSYYKCTSAGCVVRKHVERASHNLKCVITTYEGKHNHEVPAAKNSSHTNSGGGNLPPTAPNTQAYLTLPRRAQLPNSEPQNLTLRFDRKMEYNSELFNSNYLAKFGGASSLYQMKFPSLPSATPYDSSGLNFNPNSSDMYQSAIVPTVPHISTPLQLGVPCSSTLAIANYPNPERLGLVETPYFGQELKDGDLRLLRPKQEHIDDTFYNTSLSNIDQINASSSRSVHRHIMGCFPP
ncbi:hypothetical protein Ancab_000294 [Ancistrocladus abbreviatus]